MPWHNNTPNNHHQVILFDGPLCQGDFFVSHPWFSPRRRPHTIETKWRLYKCALREFSVLPVCRLRGTAASRKRQNDLLSGRRNFCVAVVAAVPKIIRALSADAYLDVSLLRRETVRSCGGLNAQNCRYSASLQAKKSGQDTCLYSRHTVGTPNILVRAAPRHPANASRHAKEFRVP